MMTVTQKLLMLFAEYAAEVAKRVAKAAHEGLYAAQGERTNCMRIREEVYDLVAIVDLIDDCGLGNFTAYTFGADNGGIHVSGAMERIRETKRKITKEVLALYKAGELDATDSEDQIAVQRLEERLSAVPEEVS